MFQDPNLAENLFKNLIPGSSWSLFFPSLICRLSIGGEDLFSCHLYLSDTARVRMATEDREVGMAGQGWTSDETVLETISIDFWLNHPRGGRGDLFLSTIFWKNLLLNLPLG